MYETYENKRSFCIVAFVYIVTTRWFLALALSKNIHIMAGIGMRSILENNLISFVISFRVDINSVNSIIY